MNIPEDLKPLFGIVGQEKALEVIRVYEGTNVYFSKTLLRQHAHEKIKNAYRDGLSYKELAEKYGYSESYVRRICNPQKID